MTATTLAPPKKTNHWKTFGITIIALTVLVIVFMMLKNYWFPSVFTPVSLSSHETATLNQKLGALNLPQISHTHRAKTSSSPRSTSSNQIAPQVLEPQAYTEVGASREVSFSEKEINAIIAHNTDLADKLAIDLSDQLASARLLMPLDPDLPLLGGKTLALNAGIEISVENSRPIVKLRGVSAWGIPIPNAWLGHIKNVDLVNEFGTQDGFWKSFAEGIEYIKIAEGRLEVTLKE